MNPADDVHLRYRLSVVSPHDIHHLFDAELPTFFLVLEQA